MPARNEGQRAGDHERAEKAHYQVILARHGKEALYLELYRSSLGFILTPAPWEQELIDRLVKKLGPERTAELAAQVEAEFEAERSTW